MSHTWKLLPIAAAFALGLVVLLPGSGLSGRVNKAYAAQDCSLAKRTITIKLIDDNTGEPITVAGTRIIISPNPAVQGGTSRTYVDNGSNDGNTTDTGTILATGVCQTDAGYTISVDSLPGAYGDCDTPSDQTINVGSTSPTVTFTLTGCPQLTPTATATTSVTPTTTVGPASGVTVSASPTSLGCNGTSIITVQVKDAAGNPVAAGTAVSLTATKGTVSPPTGTTANDGSLFVFYSAPSNTGGSADISATAGSASGKVTITVNCNTAPTATTAPPPTVSTGGTGGVISPPNTGDAGLSGKKDSIGWETYGAIVLVLVSAAGTLLLVRSRVRD